MQLFTEVAVLSLTSIALFYFGRMYFAMNSLTEFVKKYSGGIAGRRLHFILLLLGEKWGTKWINLMGLLCILAGIFSLGATVYILIVDRAF
jgi:hypothetical protein